MIVFRGFHVVRHMAGAYLYSKRVSTFPYPEIGQIFFAAPFEIPAVLDSFNLAWNPADQTVSRLEEGKRRNLPPSPFPSFPPSLIQAKLRWAIPRGS